MFVLYADKVLNVILTKDKTTKEIYNELMKSEDFRYPKEIKLQKTIKRKQISDGYFKILFENGLIKFNKSGKLYVYHNK